MPRKHMNDIERAKAIAWSQERVSQADIAKRLKVGKRTIERLIAKHKQGPEESIPRRKKGSGRPKKITKGEIKKIKKAIEENPMLTSKEIKTKLKLQISPRSIRRILLNDLELKSFVAAKKPLLTKSMKQDRIKFAKKYLRWTPQMWRQCIFTDESSFETSIGCGYRRVRRKFGENRYQEKFTKKTTKHPPSIMIWACISARGPGQICLLPPNSRIDSKMYVKVLKEFLLPSMGSLKSKYMFQDKATPHTSKMTTLYLKESRIQTVTLPGSSPDINPIENCFSFVKSKLEKEDISSLPKLRSCIRSNWNKLDRKYLEKLCLSMPRRLREVLKRNGNMTKY